MTTVLQQIAIDCFKRQRSATLRVIRRQQTVMNTACFVTRFPDTALTENLREAPNHAHWPAHHALPGLGPGIIDNESDNMIRIASRGTHR
ncbi:hypothetical protein [Kribbella sp. HUAS MG21]|uniref:Uncharacterized protein n=1 Tax=Kribbella sp. HUAS MG21 TaxID=3160966 RepID=A0AAU7TFK9_9ACTN